VSGLVDRDKLRAQLVRHEGMKLRPYRDTVGKLTIGVGRNLDDVGISKDEAHYLLSGDIDHAVRGLLGRYPSWFPDLDPVRQAVLVNMAFNLGLAGLGSFTRMLDAVSHRQYGLAADHMVASKWAHQVGHRSGELAAQMKTGQWQV
jgi:lysozyme